MIGSLMKLTLAAFAVGASGAGKLRKEERAIYRQARCKRRSSLEAAKKAQEQQERLMAEVRRAS